MVFDKEPVGYERTILSDLQGAWNCLLDAAINCRPFQRQNDLVFHIHEAISWENVRDLQEMNKALILIKNIIQQTCVDDEVRFWLGEVNRIFQEVREKFSSEKRC